MATDKQPAPLEEVEVPAGMLVTPEITLDESSEYQSSEQLQRAHAADVFAQSEKQNQRVVLTEKQKVNKLLDKVIKEHTSTVGVRKLAKDNKRGAMYQLDLSADIVTILEKIKSELR